MPRSIVSAQTHCSASPTGDEIRKAATLPKGKSLIYVDYSFAHSLSAGTPSPQSNLFNTSQTIPSPKFLLPSTLLCQGDPPQSPVLISDRKYHVDSLGYQKEQNPAQRRRIRKANARKRTQRRLRYVQLAPMPGSLFRQEAVRPKENEQERTNQNWGMWMSRILGVHVQGIIRSMGVCEHYAACQFFRPQRNLG